MHCSFSRRSFGLARGPDHPQITPSNLVSEQFGAGTNQFAPLAGLAETVPAQQDYLFGSSYLEALYFPIPRAVWPDKPQGAIVMVIGTFSDPANGESFLEYGEMYANFGLLGVLLGCVLFATLLELMWIRSPRVRESRLICVPSSHGDHVGYLHARLRGERTRWPPRLSSRRKSFRTLSKAGSRSAAIRWTVDRDRPRP